jgi:hypothetical protein
MWAGAVRRIWFSQCRSLGGVKPGPNWPRSSRSAPERTAVLAARLQTFAAGFRLLADSCQLVEQRLRVFQVGGVKALSEPAVDGRE